MVLDIWLIKFLKEHGQPGELSHVAWFLANVVVKGH